MIQDPSTLGFGTLLPSGYEWLKTADRTLRHGLRVKYDRTEEWTGADYIDEDVYDTAI